MLEIAILAVGIVMTAVTLNQASLLGLYATRPDASASSAREPNAGNAAHFTENGEVK